MKALSGAAAVLLLLAPAVLTAGLAPAEAQAPHHWKRGETLPAAVLQAGPNGAYAAQHLRRPPAGYGWFAVDRAWVLASLASGLVLEVVES